MDIFDMAETCMYLLDNLDYDEIMKAVNYWFEGEEAKILNNICRDGLMESADEDPERVQDFYEYLQTTFGKKESE